MSTIHVSIPDSISKRALELAERDGVAVEQFIASAVAEKIAALDGVSYLRKRAEHGNPQELQRLLSRVSNSDPQAGDEISPENTSWINELPNKPKAK